MQKADLHDMFDAKVAEFEKFRGFITKAKDAGDRFRQEVIDKVVADNETKAMEVAGELMLIVGDVEAHIADLRSQRSEIAASVESTKMSLQELELRVAIGDLEQDDFETQSADLTAAAESADNEIGEMDFEIEALGEIMNRWKAAGVAAGMLEEEDDAAA